jgi:hypothetical protein
MVIIKRINNTLFYLFFTVTFAYSQKIPDVGIQLMNELEAEHNILSYPISWNGSVSDFVLIDDDTLVFPYYYSIITNTYVDLIKYSLSNEKEKERIAHPPEWDEKLVTIKSIDYDHPMNAIHILIDTRHMSGRRSGNDTSMYYILYLDENRWERIPEIDGFIIYQCNYNVYKEILYILPLMAQELLVFDMKERKYIDKISRPDDLFSFGRSPNMLKFYGDPLQIFMLIHTEDANIKYYCFFDTETETSKLFQIQDDLLGYISEDFVILEDHKILMEKTVKRNEPKILELDIPGGSITTVLENIPHTIYKLKKLGNGKVGFIIAVHDPLAFPNFGDKTLMLFCLWDYPHTRAPDTKPTGRP